MSKWGKKVEYSETELRVILNLCAKDLLRQIMHASIDPTLANVVKKLAKLLAPKGSKVQLGPREVIVGGKVIATVDDVAVDIVEATVEELAEFAKEPVVLLVKPADFAVKEVKP